MHHRHKKKCCVASASKNGLHIATGLLLALIKGTVTSLLRIKVAVVDRKVFANFFYFFYFFTQY